MGARAYVIGVDFGSDSVRAVIMNARTGETIGQGDCEYLRWMEGKYSDSSKSIFRQHPLDYIEAFECCVKKALKEAGPKAVEAVKAIAVDTTGSTPTPVDADGIPLALHEKFGEDINAMFYMWKDHSALEEAEEINRVFSNSEVEDYTRFQGKYSSEWWWAKILHAKRTAPEICQAASTWVEHSDWIPALLTGNTKPSSIVRNACGAGHKALWHSDFDGLPSKEVLNNLDPYLAAVADTYSKPKTAGTALGKITKEWAERLGLNTDVIVGSGSFDAHAGAVGAGIKPKTLVKVIGTSTVDMLVEERDVLRGKDVQDICGQAENSIIPGYVGIESGQAAFGDVFSWFRKIMMWPVKDFLAQYEGIKEEEKEACAKRYYKKLIGRLEDTDLFQNVDLDIISLDWFNGRRYPMTNDSVKGIISGLTLGATAPQIYASLALSTIFGAKRILEAMVTRGLQIDNIIAVGGVAKKSAFIMQTMADVLNRPIMVSQAEQCCATGAAIYAAVAAGIYPDVLKAAEHMSENIERTYTPILYRKGKYDLLYKKYLNLCRHCETMQIELESLVKTED